MRSDRAPLARKDTSVITVTSFDRCYQGHAPEDPTGDAEVMVRDRPYCLEHGAEALAGALRGLPHADRYYPPFVPSMRYHEEVPA